jgi:NADH:ubiquinone oxidoreductase subunit 6 (subunit J)
LFFKVWLLMRQLQIVAGVLAVVVLWLLVVAAYDRWDGALFTYTLTVKEAGLAVGLAVLSLLGLGFVGKLVRYRKTATEIVIGIGMALFGFVLARLHLHVFDKLFLWQGQLRRFLSRT